jgi:starch phosphorylase
MLEKWPVEVVGKLLPRHLELINIMNYFFLDKVKKEHPYDYQKRLSRLSIIDGHSNV